MYSINSEVSLFKPQLYNIILSSYLCIGTSNSIVVCISPLTSLMIDQLAKFQSLSVKLEFVGEAQDDKVVEKK